MTSPVMALPPEILAQFFAEASRDAHETYIRGIKHEELPEDPDLPRPYSWIRLTHVCRLWRAIALSRPALWTDVSIIDPDATEEIMARTANRTITLTFRLPPKSVTNGDLPWAQADARMDLYGWLLETEIHRITAITAPAILLYLSPPICVQATLLHTLTIVAPNVGNIRAAPAEFAFPALAHLDYRAAGAHSPAPLLRARTLRSMRVHPAWADAVDPAATHVLGARALLDALRGLPLLEALDVRVAGARDAALEDEPVSVPRLRAMRLVGPAAACALVLARVALPPDARLDIECIAPDATPDAALIPVPHALASHLSAPPHNLCAPCTVFAIESVAGAYVLRGCRRAGARYKEEKADVVLRCREAGPEVGLLLRAFGLHGVEHVRIMGALLGKVEDMVGFGRLVRGEPVRSVVLDGVTAELVNYLLPMTKAAEVTLEDVRFELSHSEVEERAPKPSNTLRQLAALLATRTAEERSLRRLTITRAKNVRADDVEALRAHVAEVEWDGVESTDLSYDRSASTGIDSVQMV